MKRVLHAIFSGLARLFAPNPHLNTELVDDVTHGHPRNFHGDVTDRQRRDGPAENPIAQAADDLLAPRHASQQEVRFRHAGHAGTIVKRSEEWFRETDGMRVVRHQTFMVTCSGQVVPPEQVKSRCAECGGFDASLTRCARCQAALCALHSRVFEAPGLRMVLCSAHLREAVDNFNTWAARDHLRQHGPVPGHRRPPGTPPTREG